MKRLFLLLPFLVFVGACIFLFKGLWLNPSELPSPLIGKSFPEFRLKDTINLDNEYNQKDLKGKVSLINVWGSWCPACKIEHQVLNELATKEKINIVGINYKDNISDAQKWLKDFGDPYEMHIFDNEGLLGVDLGVYGAPETFIIDRNGIIRYKFIGPISPDDWYKELKPIYQQLIDER